jgi:hypothetical protein
VSNLPDLKGLAIFAKVVQTRSFVGAAGELRLSKGTVSKVITRLEKKFGTRLFNRTARRLAVAQRSPLWISPGNTSIPRRTPGLALTANFGSIGALYNLTMDPCEKYDMVFNGAAPSRVLTSSPGKYSGEDNGWVLSLIYPVIIDFDKSIIKYPNITRFVGGASTDLVPDLQHPDKPVPLLKDQIDRLHIGGNGG